MAVVVAVAGLVVLVGGFGIDSWAHRHRVVRHVSLAGRSVGGMRRAALDRVAESLGTTLAAAVVQVDAAWSSRPFSTTAAAIKLHSDDIATASLAMQTGRRGWLGARFASWIASWIRPRRARLVVVADQSAAEAVLAANDPGRVPAVEPEVRGGPQGFTVTPGHTGHGIDLDALMAGLGPAAERAAAAGGQAVVRLTSRAGEIAPRFSLAQAERLRAKAEAGLTRPLPVSAGGPFRARLPVALMRSWVRSTPGPADLQLRVDPAAAVPDLAKLLPDAGSPPVETRFGVVDGRVEVAPGRPGLTCCADGAADLIARALFGGAFPEPPAPPLALPLRTVPPRVPPERVAALAITTPVGAFTTTYQTTDPRVANIRRMADLVRGWVILPGETFSLNDVAGPRTAERGFVPAQIVVAGHRYGTGLGGGVAQFATTLLNASYPAGLDVVEHHSPELFDPRYPLGRDATISYPQADLKLRNGGPFGVLIWPTYDDAGITVTLYSTAYATGAQTAQTVSRAGACRRVRTQRTRTYPDGSTVVDHLDAFYYPGEGKSC